MVSGIRKKIKILLSIILLILTVTSFTASDDPGFTPLRRKLRYVEEFYRLYTRNHMAGTDSIGRNLQYLKYALDAPWIHPVQALCEITTLKQREQYRNLLITRILFLLARGHVQYGWRYDQEKVMFYNRRFRKELLGSFEIARYFYKLARRYWVQAQKSARLALTRRLLLRGSHIEDIYNETRRIHSGEINYGRIIRFRLRDLDRKIVRLKAIP